MKLATHANRGMALEQLIEHANAQYATKGIALIQKVATPWKIIRNGKQIVSAFPEKKSTVDFIGTYRGKPIAFDAKSTENKTRFPYANIDDHQLDFMKQWEDNGGIAFFLIEFKAHGRIFIAPSGYFIGMKGAGGSMPYKEFLAFQNVHEVHQGNGIVLNYLKEVQT